MGDWDGLPGIGPRLFYGDTSTGVIHEFGFDDSGDAIPENILSINQDENGEIFILGVDFIGGQWQGNVTRVLPAITADFNDDGFYNCLDIDALTAEIAAATNDSQFDLTGDGLVDQSDLEGWLAMAGENNLGPDSAYLPGDANLDGVVDISDFNIWNMNKFSVANWCGGDFNASGAVDVSDFNIWNVHKFSAAQSIPEPSGLWHMAGWLFLILAQRRWTLR
jgi:hypothetical protein